MGPNEGQNIVPLQDFVASDGNRYFASTAPRRTAIDGLQRPQIHCLAHGFELII